MGSEHRLLTRGPGYAATPPTPAELEAAAEKYQERHRLRLDGLERLRQLEVELADALEEALQPIHATATSSRLTRLLVSVGLLEPERASPPPIETLWSRHEHALEKVRALAHHIELLDRDLVLLEQEIPQLTERVRLLSVDRVKAEAFEVALMSALQRLPATPSDGEDPAQRDALEQALRQTRRERRRLAAAVERLRSLKLLHQELHEVLLGVSDGLQQLYSDANAALGGLNRRITGLAAEAAAAELGAGGGLETLQRTLSELAITAGKRAIWLEGNLDSLGEKLARLDAEAAARRRAREEVEVALSRRSDA